MPDNSAIGEAAAALVAALTAARKTLATAESCTGGWIAKAITDVPGSSGVFGYGIVSYSNDAKEALLGVSKRTLADDGAVSEATVVEMAEGALTLSGADMGVAVTGIAGPDGGSDAKPVGTVWFAWTVRSDDKLSTYAERKLFDGDRSAIRSQTVLHALKGVRVRLAG